MKRDPIGAISVSPHKSTVNPLLWRISPLGASREWIAEWEDLNQRTCDTPLLSGAMVLSALQQFGAGNERLAIARQGHRTSAMAILRPKSKLAWKVFQPSQLPLATFITDSPENFESVARSLLSALPAHVLALSIHQLDTNYTHKPAHGGCAIVLPHMNTGAIDFPFDRDKYFDALAPSLRSNIERRTRRAIETIGKPTLEVVTEREAVESYLALYSATESSGWKGRVGTAVRANDAQGDFYRSALSTAALEGRARMFVLRFGDTPVAQQIAIEHAGVLYLLKTTYDESYKKLAPGVLQRFHVLRWAAANKINRVELYGRLSEWQRPFITSAREIFHATFFRNRAVRLVRDSIRLAWNRSAQPFKASIET